MDAEHLYCSLALESAGASGSRLAKVPVKRGLLSQEQFAAAFDLARQGAVQRQGQHPGHHQPTGAVLGFWQQCLAVQYDRQGLSGQ